jgi:hypothetical protein
MPRLTVSTPATTRALVSLARVKRELGITVSGDDDVLADKIAEASAAIVAHCRVAADHRGRRTFAEEECSAAFDADEMTSPDCEIAPLILPWRIPVTAIASIVENGVTLASADYQLEPMSALIWRMNSGMRSNWAISSVVVTYTAGWDLVGTELPSDIAAAALALVKASWFGRLRDPLIKSEDVPGVGSTQWWVGSTGGDAGSLPKEVVDSLAPYRAAIA